MFFLKRKYYCFICLFVCVSIASGWCIHEITMTEILPEKGFIFCLISLNENLLYTAMWPFSRHPFIFFFFHVCLHWLWLKYEKLSADNCQTKRKYVFSLILSGNLRQNVPNCPITLRPVYLYRCPFCIYRGSYRCHSSTFKLIKVLIL